MARLRRWRDHGGTFAASDADAHGRVVVSLLRCDGGEEADRFSTDDAGVIAWIRRESDA